MTAILIHQLYDITIDYFSYKTVIIIDTKAYESDNNYPFVTLSTRTRTNLLLFELVPWKGLNFTVSNSKLIDKPAVDNIWWYVSVEVESINATMVTVNSSQYLDGHYYTYEGDDNYRNSTDAYYSTRTVNFNHYILNAKQSGQFASVKERSHKERYNNEEGMLCSLFY